MMKRLLASAIVLVALASCSNKNSENMKDGSNKTSANQEAKARNSEADTTLNNIATDRNAKRK